MHLTEQVKEIISYYGSDNPGTKANIARILMSGKLAGTGKMVILPVDQGFEHGPARSFAQNPKAYDPYYHIQLAIDAELNAYAAPLGMLEAVANDYANCIPLILKINSANSMVNKAKAPDQALTSSVKDALRLGCSAIGFTIYPGSDKLNQMIEEIKDIAQEAKSYGLAVVIWSYPRGSNLSKDGETSLDIVAYAAHIAALLGAHIIKVKLPTDYLECQTAKIIYEKYNINRISLKMRVAHIMEAAFNGRRIVVFSGGANKDLNSVYEEAKAIKEGGGNGSIIGRNTFQRPREEALKMLSEIISIYS